MNKLISRGVVTPLALSLFFMLLMIGSVEAGSDLKTYQKAADDLAADLNRRSSKVFVNMLDFDTIVDEALQGVSFSDKDKKDFRSGMEQAKPRLGDKIVGQISESGYAKVLRVRKDGKIARALMRLDYGDMGYGYMDLHLQKQGKKVRIVDWYDYSLGQNYTRSLNQIVAMIAPTPTLMGRIFDIATNRKSDLDNLQKFLLAVNKQGYAEAMKIHKKLSKEAANSRMVSLILVQAASATGNDEYYREALTRLAKHHSNDPSLAFILIDHYFYKQDFNKVVSIIDSLTKEFGVQDAAQLSMKADVLVEKGDYNGAVKAARIARKLEPDLEATYWSLLSANIGARNYRDAVKAGDVLEKKFNYMLTKDNLSEDEYYQGFLNSKEFRNWEAGKAR